MRRRSLALIRPARTLLPALLLALAAPAPAAAQARTHDGFFLQMDVGVGGMASQVDLGPTELEFSGGAGEFSVAVGGAVSENLILAGHVWATSIEDPTVKINGREIGEADSTLTLSGLGLNITYYLMPANVYLSITPSITTLTAETDGHEADSESGFGLRLALGKEWWVSDNWALGLNGQVAVSRNEDAGENFDTAWVGIAFSATFN